MVDTNPKCPKCSSVYTYQDQTLWVCPECSHEWSVAEKEDLTSPEPDLFLDAHGVQLQDGDSVKTIKELKAGKTTIKSGTKVKGIKLLDDPVDGHDISCKIPGLGAMYLKCSVVKKIT